MQMEDIAKVCHEANRAYCATLGDDSQKPWDEADDWQRESSLAGVTYLVDNPDAPPSYQHDQWMAYKLRNGWVHGDTQDADAKTHPCLVPFDDLPDEQRLKDVLFQAVARALIA